jgi:hypothetical protein
MRPVGAVLSALVGHECRLPVRHGRHHAELTRCTEHMVREDSATASRPRNHGCGPISTEMSARRKRMSEALSVLAKPKLGQTSGAAVILASADAGAMTRTAINLSTGSLAD